MRILEIPIDDCVLADGYADPNTLKNAREVASSLEGLIAALNYDEVDTENNYLYLEKD